MHVIDPSASTLPAREDSGARRLRACVLGCAKLPLLTRKPSQGTAKLHQEENMSKPMVHGAGNCKPGGLPQPTELGPPFCEVSYH